MEPYATPNTVKEGVPGQKTFQFTCAVRITAPDTPWDGELYVIPGLLTPPVTAENRGEAMRRTMNEHPTINWDPSTATGTEYVIFEQVRGG